MYIEVFLLDNFIFNMIIIKIASALSTRKYSRHTAIIICVLEAVYSAFAINIAVMRCLIAKVVLCFLFAAPFFVEQHKISVLPILFIFLSTLMVGGFVFAFNEGGSSLFYSKWLRLVLYPAFILMTFPTIIRHLKRKQSIRNRSTKLYFTYNNKSYEFDAIFDSGNTLYEPISGLPVIMIYSPELMSYAEIPLIYSDSTTTMKKVYAFSPKTINVNGVSINMLIAPTDMNPNMKALIPVIN